MQMPPIAVASGVSSNRDSAICFFLKDGRKICVGDCALFKAAQDSPASVGIIRSFTADKESNLLLGVKWLYRPAKVKLLKGVALEAVPNEVFYSFLWDEIPAASLLHPCKVAFLPKGAELPAGAASFVCRRVYDITNKCLWWLSDQDFIDERQEEVDKLLHKTHLEMHALVEQQQGLRSPKPPNGSAATSPRKHNPDCVQNSSSYLHSKMTGKKRDREDQSLEIIKRERNARGDDGDSYQLRSERFLNIEVAKVAEKGGLADSEAVAKLVRLMQPERSQRKIDLAGRSMLAGIIAATDKLDYLRQFIQLRGLVVLDEWLQEVHKGKIGGSGNEKDSDKSVENFIMVLLCALVKLPVNLNALQTCNIGKSVNYLRSHKNSEIQKKARSLVDTWKKRVEAEMTINDAKTGSTQVVPSPDKSRDAFHGIGGYRHSGGSSEAAIRSFVTHHSSMKSSSVKLAQGEPKLKSGPANQSNARSALSHVSTIINCKDEQSKTFVYGGSSEAPQTAAREEKSSGSSQSYTGSQCSSDHAKYLVPCGKEDVKKSTAGFKSLGKTTGSESGHRKLANGSPAGVHKETTSNRSSLVEKISHKATDGLVHVGNIPKGNYHKLIVKIPNRVHGPAQSIVAVSTDDPFCRNSRASSPALSERLDKSDASLRGTHDSHKSDEHQRSADTRRLPDVSNAACSPASNEKKFRKPNGSFSSFNALIESCVRLSEADVSMSTGDDVGINLLASVAVGEFSNSAIASPAVSPHRPSTTAGKEKPLQSDNAIQQEDVSADIGGADDCNISSVASKLNDGESTQHLGIAHEDLHQKEEGCLRDNGISDEHVTIACSTGRSVADVSDEVFNGKGEDVEDGCRIQPPASSESVASHVEAEDKVKDVSPYDKAANTAHSDTAYPSINDDDVVKNNVCMEPESLTPMEQNLHPVSLHSESRFTDETPLISSRTSQHLIAVNAAINLEKTASVELCDHAHEEGNRRLVRENGTSQILEKQEDPGVACADVTVDTSCKDKNLNNREVFVQQSRNSSPQLCSSAVLLPNDLPSSTNETKFEGERSADSGAATVNAVSFPASGVSDVKVKHEFDLNEGVNVDDGKHAEPASVAASTKGIFAPPDDLLRRKTDFGWKGSASTSAFRPVEPRKLTESPLCSNEVPSYGGVACKQARPPLDFDLNVADESFGQESDFDLNKIEGPDVAQQSASNSLGIEVSIPSVKALPYSIFSNGEASGKIDFDLNDGPAIEEMSVEQTSYIQPGCNNNPLQSSFIPRFYNPDARNLIAWNPPGTSYSVSVSPSALPDGKAFPVAGLGGGPHRVMGGSTSSLSFYPDTYRGPVLASSPAMPFQPAPFQYPVFRYGTTFPPTSALSGPSGYVDPAASGRISAIPSQLVGNAAGVSFQYPYVVSRPISDVSNNGVFDMNQKWGKQGLDLNSGPGCVDLEGIDGAVPTVSRQVSAIGSQSLVEEQAMMYSLGGGVLKRKEPDGGSSMDMLNFKQPSWWR